MNTRSCLTDNIKHSAARQNVVNGLVRFTLFTLKPINESRLHTTMLYVTYLLIVVPQNSFVF